MIFIYLVSVSQFVFFYFLFLFSFYFSILSKQVHFFLIQHFFVHFYINFLCHFFFTLIFIFILLQSNFYLPSFFRLFSRNLKWFPQWNHLNETKEFILASQPQTEFLATNLRLANVSLMYKNGRFPVVYE